MAQESYFLKIPFEEVNSKCAAFTSFVQVGCWNHKPALPSQKKSIGYTILAWKKIYQLVI